MIVGAVNTLFGYGISLICLNLIGMSAGISAAADYIFGSILSYFLNKRFTFNEKGNSWGYILKFALNNCLCFLLAYGIAEPAVASLLSSASDILRDNILLIVIKGLYLVFNYIGQRFFVFTKQNEKSENNEDSAENS